MELVPGLTWHRVAAVGVIICAAIVGFFCAVTGPFGRPGTDSQNLIDGAPLPTEDLPSRMASTSTPPARSAGTAAGTPSEPASSGSRRSGATPASATGNLVRNGDAEVGTCSGGGTGTVAIPDWTVLVGSPQLVCYGADGFPQPSEGPLAPETPGNAFFVGGKSPTTVLQQTMVVTFAAAAIDAHASTYAMSTWLGGKDGEGDAAGLVATFVGGSGQVLDSAILGPVTAAQRGGVTVLFKESTTGSVPTGTRTIILTLTFVGFNGDHNDGYADDLVFRLT